MKIRTLLVPVDFSPASRLAVDCAVAFARQFHATLTLLHVVELPIPMAYTFPIESREVEKQHYRQALRLLPALVAQEDQDDLDLQIRVRYGDIKNEILSAVSDEHFSMVVMGTHGRGLLSRLLIGSVTGSLLRKLPVPVLTVSGVYRPMTFSRILFATDFAAGFHKGFAFAASLAHLTQAKLVVLHSIEQHSIAFGGTVPIGEIETEKRRLAEEAHKELKKFEAEGRRQNVKVETVLTEGAAADRILAAATDEVADLIVLAIRGKGTIERAILGSTAERVIREAHVPVLSVPVKEAKWLNSNKPAE